LTTHFVTRKMHRLLNMQRGSGTSWRAAVIFLLAISYRLDAEPCGDALAKAQLAKDGVSESIAAILDKFSQEPNSDPNYLESVLSFVYGEENGEPKTYYWQNDFSAPRKHSNILDRMKKAYPDFKALFVGSTFFMAEKASEHWDYRITSLIQSPSQIALTGGRAYQSEDLYDLVANIASQDRIRLQDKRPVLDISWPGVPKSLSIPDLLQPVGAP